ncbi:MAG TPA: SAM-dependent methyltransferase [Rhizomicrobium sp.]|nr:SAM-dependent methyltransferase [Rhizomicrobium sp.]
MTALRDRIAALIASQGPISIAEYMTLVLPAYYATRDPLGAKGDFITSPEVSQMFGELIGLWLAQAWHDQGKPARPLLVEMGPGRGTLMADALRAMKLMPELRDAVEVVLVETSLVLRKVQEGTLRESSVPVRWADSFEDVPRNRPLLLVANEFFDALPIRQYVKTDRGWCERMVMLDARGELGFGIAPVAIGAGLVPRDGAPLGAVYETSPPGDALAEEIGFRIAHDGGAALVIDYGYGADAGFAETLQAVKSHSFTDVLIDPSASDLSAHVDFAALASAARRGGASVAGPASQGDFLDGLGIRHRADALANVRGADPEKIYRQVARLIDDDQMGTLFKVISILPPNAPKPPGL